MKKIITIALVSSSLLFAAAQARKQEISYGISERVAKDIASRCFRVFPCLKQRQAFESSHGQIPIGLGKRACKNFYLAHDIRCFTDRE